MITRRRLLAGLGLGAAGASVLGAGAGCGGLGSRRAAIMPVTGTVQPSAARLPEPYTVELAPTAFRRPDDRGRIELVQREATAEILPGLQTPIWGYDGQFPGPTIEARKGKPLRVSVRNTLPTPTSTHLHGGVTPSASDGGPMDLIVPDGFDPLLLDVAMSNGHMSGQDHAMPHQPHSESVSDVWTLHKRRRTYHYPMVQDAALLWYHDHRMDFSAPQVWRGLAGMFVVRDDEEEGLELPAGDRELILMLADRSFGADGELLYPAEDPTLTRQPGVHNAYMDGVLGDVMLVNGAPAPVTRVAADAYRIRLLNACNARPLRLRFTPSHGPDLTMRQIGTDIGLLAAPITRTVLDLVPAERADLLLDLSGLPVGTEVELRNEADDGTQYVLKLVVDRPAAGAAAPLPDRLRADFELLEEGDAVTHRRFDFRLGADRVWRINGHAFDPRESLAFPPLDTVERWTFTSDFNHPVHVHLGHFQVLTDGGGRRVPPAERGWKDTVHVGPYQAVDVLIRFTHFRGVYMLHCHNLEHEDMAMMANFTTT